MTTVGAVPVPNTQVAAALTTFPWTYLWATTDASGAYTLSNVSAGSWTIQFYGPSGSDLVTEYYADAPTSWTATPVTVADGASITGIDAQLAQGSSISGTVTGPDGPLEGAQVSTWPEGSLPGYSTITDADGHYTLHALVPGSYIVSCPCPVPGSRPRTTPRWHPSRRPRA